MADENKLLSDEKQVDLAQNEQKNKEKVEKITVAELIRQTKKFLNSEITPEEFSQLGDNMTIRSYLPILDKMKLIMILVFTIENEDVEDASLKSVIMKRHLFFDVLLGQYAMVDVSEKSLCTYTSYDLLYPLFSEFILGFCKKDYDEFVEMLRDAINFNNLNNFSDIFENLDYKELQKVADKNRMMIDALKKSKEMVEHLRELYGATSEENKKLTNALEKAVIDKINAEGAKELESKDS